MFLRKKLKSFGRGTSLTYSCKMDIDEFLEREISELDLGTDNSKVDNSKEFSMQNGVSEPDSLFQNIKSTLGKGDIDEAEKAYIELWGILLQQNLKWDSGLYAQLLALSRQFLAELNKEYSEVKKKADYIYDLLKKARASLRDGKKEFPYKTYAQVIELSNSIPSVFFEEKIEELWKRYLAYL